MPVLEPERRGFLRVGLSVAAMLKQQDDYAIGRIENISLSGLYILLQNEISLLPDDLVTVDLYLHDPSQCRSVLSLAARVARVDKRGVGLQFRPMSITDHNRLQAISSMVSSGTVSSDDQAFLEYELSLLT